MKKRVILITTGQPSTNPRLVKEANALVSAGFDVLVIYAFWARWAVDTDNLLYKNSKWKKIQIGGSPVNNKILFFLTKVIHKFSRVLYSFFPVFKFLAKRVLNRCYDFQLYFLKKKKADLIIAHNLGALPVAVEAAKKLKCKVGFDAEDYHRGQNYDNLYHLSAVKYIEEKYIPLINYQTAASPLISEAYQANFPKKTFVTINNVFKKPLLIKSDIFIKQKKQKLKLFWFSQTIGLRRGLEEAIRAIGLIGANNISLTLLGECSLTVKNQLIEIAKEANLLENQLSFISPVSPEKLFEEAAKYHVGLALEIPSSYNRQICLTNKLFTYLKVGLAVIATDTKAQKKIFVENPGFGFIFNINNIKQLSDIIKLYYLKPDLLENHRKEAIQLATSKYNWEKESKIFLSTIKKVLNH